MLPVPITVTVPVLTATAVDTTVPVHVAYTALTGNSRLTPGAELCGACGQHVDTVTPWTDVVSDNFTDWDRCARDSNGVCRACAWAFTTRDARTYATLVTDTGTARVVPFGELAGLLSRPVPFALTVPVTGRKHLLPFATWGVVTADHGSVPWGHREARLARALTTLLDGGVPVSTFDPVVGVPPVALVHGYGLFEAWDVMKAWHGSPQYTIALLAARRRRSGTFSSEGEPKSHKAPVKQKQSRKED